ncbi:tetratricopeptide repeat protein [Nostoc sp. NZL]|nr:tetratricopeptide repeat protein [Nostoc sp. NZL]MBG1243021.1 tetratricopeptide repeat protein [Nostoc sp. NZL]
MIVNGISFHYFILKFSRYPIADYDQAIKINPNSAEAYANRGVELLAK